MVGSVRSRRDRELSAVGSNDFDLSRQDPKGEEAETCDVIRESCEKGQASNGRKPTAGTLKNSQQSRYLLALLVGRRKLGVDWR